MGSIHSMPLPTTPPLLREFNPSSYRVYASFCPKEQGVSNQLECYDPSNNKSVHDCPIPEIIDNHVLKDLPWSPKEMLRCRQWYSGVTFDQGNGPNVHHWEYHDPAVDMWTPLPNMSTMRSGAPLSCSIQWRESRNSWQGCGSWTCQLYFLAGFRIAGEISRTVSMAYIFDTAAVTSDAWRSFDPTEEDGEKELCIHCCVVKPS
ncbi:hypothetical protein SLE2022_390890 [Rubroshorea leprosula]